MKDGFKDLKRLAVDVNILVAKQLNSTASRKDRLVKIPNSEGNYPEVFPQTLDQLLVAGNESRTNKRGTRAGWNREMSNAVLEFYEMERLSGGEVSSDDEDYEKTSRAKRLKVARAIGVTKTQLNFAILEAPSP